jgi:hypothetical protein
MNSEGICCEHYTVALNQNWLFLKSSDKRLQVMYLCSYIYNIFEGMAEVCGSKVKVKLSMCFNWAPSHLGVLGEWRYSSTHSWPLH